MAVDDVVDVFGVFVVDFVVFCDIFYSLFIDTFSI